MKYMIDTNIFLWYFLDNHQLPQKFKEIIADPNIRILISIASLWEMTIKSSKGNLNIIGELGDFFQREIIDAHFEILPIKLDHLLTLRNLPFHHKDPFDRLIIAQSITKRWHCFIPIKNLINIFNHRKTLTH